MHWSPVTERRRRIFTDVIAGLKENLGRFPRYQSHPRDNQLPALIVWEPQDAYTPEQSVRACLRDLPQAELHLFDGALAAGNKPR